MILRNKSGTILIITLWILAILAVFAIGLGHRTSLELRLTGYHRDRLKAFYIAKAAVMRAIVELERDASDNNYDALNEKWSNGYDFETEGYTFRNIQLGDGQFTISYSYVYSETEKKEFYGMADEERKININTAPREILESLPEVTKEMVSSIIDWRDSDDQLEYGGAENSYYQSLKPPYDCKNGPFDTIEEILLLKEVTPEVLSNIKDMITIYGTGLVNINTVTPDVLLVLCNSALIKKIPEVGEGETNSIVEKVMRFRSGVDGEAGTEDDNVFTNMNNMAEDLKAITGEFNTGETNLLNYLKPYLAVTSNNFKINATATLKDGKIQETISCIVERSQGSVIKYWHKG